MPDIQVILQTINRELSPPIQAVKKGVETYLPESNEQACIFWESAALIHLTVVTLKNLPYVLLANGFGINDFFHFISSKTNYLELACISIASAVYNFFLAIFYTGMMAVTLGLSTQFNYSCKKHWMHIVYSITTLAISIIGVVSPFVGMILTVRLYFHYYRVLKSNYKNDLSNFEAPLVRQIKNAFLQNKNAIEDSIYDLARDRYDKEFGPSLEEIEKRIRKATKMDDLVNLGIFMWYKFPQMKNEKEPQRVRRWGNNSPAAKDNYN